MENSGKLGKVFCHKNVTVEIRQGGIVWRDFKGGMALRECHKMCHTFLAVGTNLAIIILYILSTS